MSGSRTLAPRRLALVTLCLGAGSALGAPAAVALPEDPQIEAVSPAEGATVAANPNGIAVVYTCPPYQSFRSSRGAADGRRGGVGERGVERPACP